MNTESSTPVGGRSPHVLVVDDDPDIRTVLNDYLAKNDIRVTTVASGREMLQAFESDLCPQRSAVSRTPGSSGRDAAWS